MDLDVAIDAFSRVLPVLLLLAVNTPLVSFLIRDRD